MRFISYSLLLLSVSLYHRSNWWCLWSSFIDRYLASHASAIPNYHKIISCGQSPAVYIPSDLINICVLRVSEESGSFCTTKIVGTVLYYILSSKRKLLLKFLNSRVVQVISFCYICCGGGDGCCFAFLKDRQWLFWLLSMQRFSFFYITLRKCLKHYSLDKISRL